jgi:hypothetical protein
MEDTLLEPGQKMQKTVREKKPLTVLKIAFGTHPGPLPSKGGALIRAPSEFVGTRVQRSTLFI